MEAVRDRAKSEREVEEARLRKRQKRLNPETAQAGSRAGSVAPGTPGAGAAPESETTAKAPSKKELKKGAAAARLAEASSTASANQTLGTIMGSFGKKRKEYSWIKKPGSGASTSRTSLGDQAAAGAAGAAGKGPRRRTSPRIRDTRGLGPGARTRRRGRTSSSGIGWWRSRWMGLRCARCRTRTPSWMLRCLGTGTRRVRTGQGRRGW